MKGLPSRLQIALLSAGIAGLVLAVFALFAWWKIFDLRQSAVDREIQSLAMRHPGVFAGRGSFERFGAMLESVFGQDATNRVIVLIASRGGVEYQSANWPSDIEPAELGLDGDLTGGGASGESSMVKEPFATDEPRGGPQRRGFGPGRGGPPPPIRFTQSSRFMTVQSAGGPWRIGILGTEEVTLAIGLSYEELLGEMKQVRNLFLATYPLALLVVGFGGWFISGRALRPLGLIAETAEQVTASGLDQRIPRVSGSPETERLTEVLNNMMDRLEASFKQATRFSADASHELKTPLAIMQAELENALQDAPNGSAEQERYARLLQEVQRLTTITRGLLLLARADAGQLKLALAALDLTAEVEDLAEDTRALAGDAGISIQLEAQPGIQVQADRMLLRSALFNLLHNAVKYNEPKGTVTVRLTANDSVLFSVSNSGPGIPVADQSRVFERFYRLRDRPQSIPGDDGIGLGLSLAREIVRAHRGELRLTESRPGRTCFEVKLPSPVAR